MWHQPACSVAPWEGGLKKGTMASARPNARHFGLSQYATGAFQDATPVLEVRENESE